MEEDTSNVIPFPCRTFYKKMDNGEWLIDTGEIAIIITEKTGIPIEVVVEVLMAE